MKHFNWAIITLLLFIGCNKENIKFNYPLVQTGVVADITPSGATLYGKVLNFGSQEIVDHGFVWDINTLPTLEQSYIKSLGATISNTYSVKVTSAFIEGETYYVRAFIRDKNSTVYGRAVSFVSLGSNAPKITNFNPKIATWGDTVIVGGENFSSKKDENIIKFGNFTSNVIHVSDSAIATVVPLELDTTLVNISVSFLGNTTFSEEKFNLTPPEIIDFNPKEGTYETQVKIKGKYFFNEMLDTKVEFGTLSAKIIDINDSVILAEVPLDLPTGEADLSVTIATQTVFADEKFISFAPIITNFSPVSGTWNDTILIEGQNFSETISENSVKLGSTVATVTEATPTMLKVLVPVDLLIEHSNITVTVKDKSFKTTDNFTLIHPLINSFSPTSGTFRDIVTISGQYFNPVLSNNVVRFGDSIANVLEGNTNELKVTVPDNYYSEDGKNKISVIIGEISGVSGDDFELFLHSITDFNPKSGSRDDNIIITGQNFHPNAAYNKVFVGDVEASIYSCSSTSLSIFPPDGVIHGDQPVIKILIAGREIISSETFLVYEPWQRKNDLPNGPRTGSFAFSIGDKAYVGGGYNGGYNGYQDDFWEYNASSDTWIRRADLPQSVKDAVCFATTSKGYVLDEKKLWQYDPVLDQWNSVADFPGLGESGQSAFAIGDKGYVGTGYHGGSWYKKYSAEFWEYDEASDSWTQKADFVGAKTRWGIGFSIGNKGYISLGDWGDDLWEYDPATNEWTNKLSLVGIIDGVNTWMARRLAATSFIINEKAYILTGVERWGGKMYGDIYEYDPAFNSFIRLLDMPGLGRRSAVGFSINNKGYIGGGNMGEINNYSSDFWEFNPERLKP